MSYNPEALPDETALLKAYTAHTGRRVSRRFVALPDGSAKPERDLVVEAMRAALAQQAATPTRVLPTDPLAPEAARLARAFHTGAYLAHDIIDAAEMLGKIAARDNAGEPTDEQIRRLQDAIEGECDGLAVDESRARSILAAARQAATPAPAEPECVTCVRCGHENWIQDGKAMAQVKPPAAPPATPAAQPADEREAFEAWAMSRKGSDRLSIARHIGPGYVYSDTDAAWDAWQARAVLKGNA